MNRAGRIPAYGSQDSLAPENPSTGLGHGFIIPRMNRLIRLLMTIFLVGFVSGTIAHVTSATAMTMKMATMTSDAVDMADCGGCSDDSNTLVCDTVCVVPMLATIDGVALVPPSFRQDARDFVTQMTDGLVRIPDPYPPKPLALS